MYLLAFRLVFLLTLVGFAAASPATSRASDAASGARGPREVQSDPPAPSVAEALAPARADLASFSIVQVNVRGNGMNILNDAANEPSIAVDPNNPNRMAIGWRQFDSITSDFREAGWGYTRDGGRTWSFPGVLEDGVFRSDPVLNFAADGTFYYCSLKSVSGLSCDVFESNDQGASWGVPRPAFGGDKQWIAVDRTGGIGDGHIYEAWSTAGACCGTNVFTRSTNGGLSFELPSNIPDTPHWGTMDVAPNGALFVAGVDNANAFRVARSSTAQDPLAFPTWDFVSTVNLGGAISVFVTNGPNPEGLLGQVGIAVDPSTGPTAGWVYLLCTVDPPGADPVDVHFSRSTDGGNTWSTPIRINDDPSGNWQWFGTMSVAPNGRIDVVWNDTRNSGVAQVSQLFYASSSDGGTTWSANQAISPAWDSYLGWPNQFKIGDYYHMVSDAVGASLAWAATFNGEQDVYYLRIGDYDCNVNGVPDSLDLVQGTVTDLNHNGIPDVCEGFRTSDVAPPPTSFALLQNLPNPFNPSTTIHFEVPSPGAYVLLRVYDARGRVVRTLFRGYATPGQGTSTWDGKDDGGTSVASGTYYYRLEAPSFRQARAMVLVR